MSHVDICAAGGYRAVRYEGDGMARNDWIASDGRNFENSECLFSVPLWPEP